MNPGAETNTIKSRGKYDCFLAKYNNNGEFVYAKSIGSDENDNAYRLNITPDYTLAYPDSPQRTASRDLCN